MNLRVFLVATMLAIVAGFATPVSALVDFSGKTIEWIVPFEEGGGTDRWARFYAPLLSEALPGNPKIVVKNIPGDGSTRGANHFAQHARPDGLTILGTSGSTQFPYLLDDPRVRYDYRDWTVILATPTGGVVYVTPELGLESAADIGRLKGVELKFGSQGATSLDLVPLLAFELLGLKVKPVFGMKGRADGRRAFERGETGIDYQTTPAYLSDVVPLVEEGRAIPLWSWGVLDDAGNVVRDPTFPELPSFAEVFRLVHGKWPDGEAWEVWKSFFAAGFPAQKMVFLPEGTPPNIVYAYRFAFEKVVSAPDFAKNSENNIGNYTQLTGKGARSAMKVATNVDTDAKRWLRKWLKDRFDFGM